MSTMSKDASGNWKLPITIAGSGTTTQTLATQGKYLDANILVETTTPAAVASTNNPGNIDVSMTIGTASSSAYPVTFNGTSKTVTTEVTNAGWIATGTAGSSITIGITGSGSIPQSALTGPSTTGIATKTVSVSTDDQYITISSGYYHESRGVKISGDAGANPAEWQADAPTHTVTDPSITPKITITGGSGYGIVTTAPTTGSYITFDPDADKTTGTSKATSNASVTSSGKVNAGATKTGTEDSKTIDVTVNAGQNQYMPITSISVAGGALSKDSGGVLSPTASAEASGSTIELGTKTTTQPTSGAYITVTGGAAAASGSVVAKRDTITYSNAAGAISVHSDETGIASTTSSLSISSNAATTTAYYPVASASYTYGTTTTSGTTASRGVMSWTKGRTSAGSLQAASFANTGTTGTSYVDISATTDAPVLVTGGYLYINKGYTDNLKISLAKLVPDGASADLASDKILSGYSAYNNDGALIAGSIQTYNGSYT